MLTKNHFIKISIWGIKSLKRKDIDSFHDKYPFLAVPENLFNKWFDTKINSKNVEYHSFNGHGFENIAEFLKDLLDYYERIDKKTYDWLYDGYGEGKND